MDNIDLFNKILSRINVIVYNDDAELDSILKQSEMYFRKIFGESCKYIRDLKSIQFHPNYYPANESSLRKSWDSGISKLTNLINTAIEEIQLFENTSKNEKKGRNKKNDENSIFIVHGHDDQIKNEMAIFLEKAGLKPIILHQQPSSSLTIIEKIEAYSNVGYAVVLYTPCDIGAKKEEQSNLKARARQNVVFEHGYFIGHLGRERVSALLAEGVEPPNDISGVVYIDLDKNGAWRNQLGKELSNAGYDLSAEAFF